MAAPRRSAAGPSSMPMTGSGYADASELDKYKLVSNIGKGSFGVISKVQRIEDGKEFALKQLDYAKMTDKDRKQILAEVAILESLKHRNIVQLVQKIKDPKNERIFIIMEYCTSGDLGTLIRKAQRTGQPLHEDKIWNIFLQITQALHHCHWPNDRPQAKARMSSAPPGAEAARYQVLHRDLKPENVFLSDDFVKLGDFGLSKDMGNSAFTSTYVGTPLYMPPEILAENRYDTKSDIWSLGCLVFEMCALSSPFSAAQTQAELITMVKSGRLPPLPSHISPGLKNVIRAMLNLVPSKRPSTRDLLEMDEMKLHRKLFTVQNQASILMHKRDEMKQLEERFNQRAAALDERERALAAREASVEAREASCITKEEENRETQRRLNSAAEQLRGHWDKLRVEKEKESLPQLSEERPVPRRSSAAPSRPPLEERNTLPIVAGLRFPRQSTSCDDTPSKIPMASNHAVGAAIPQPTPLRRAATKSLGNLGAAYRASEGIEATPARQTMGFAAKQRTSIGSSSELFYFNEDISMASPAPSSNASPAPFVPRLRRASLAPALATTQQQQEQRQAQTQAQAGPPNSSSSSDSASSTEQENSAPPLPPTMIPAPTNTFVYREAATPAKWSVEDPDLPSPFLRRAPTAPPAQIIPNRQPLGSITLQPSASMASLGLDNTRPGTGLGGLKPKAGVPRSRSGNLHQHVLRAAHARTSGDGVASAAGGLASLRVRGMSRDPARLQG